MQPRSILDPLLFGALLVAAGVLAAAAVAAEGPLAAGLGFVVGFAGADALFRDPP